MNFQVIPSRQYPDPKSTKRAYLLTDNWDDYFEFSTSYTLVYFNDKSERIDVGSLKIGQINMVANQRTPALPARFNSLNERFFSLGQDETYYETLNLLGPSVRDDILYSLNDVAENLELFERVLAERVTGISLLRSVSKSTVIGQFNRISNGGVRLSKYVFVYRGPVQSDPLAEKLHLAFEVTPDSKPPTNIHVLIGRNGVGKTHLLNAMTLSLVQKDSEIDLVGEFLNEDLSSEEELFANLVSVTFSAFDKFEPLTEHRDKSEGMQYAYVGLKKKSTASSGNQQTAHKSLSVLAREYAMSIRNCRKGPRARRWKRALVTLESDPIFAAAEISRFPDLEDGEDFAAAASEKFSALSSGHKIVLLTTTRLVETVEEKSLLLMDEPEAHLHPPLLSAFIRALSDLLIDRNGVAIIATHSPVILQEVPRSCVWKIRRNGGIVQAERSEIETFGENVGILTREVFGLEVTNSGFHNLLTESIKELDSYQAVIAVLIMNLAKRQKRLLEP